MTLNYRPREHPVGCNLDTLDDVDCDSTNSENNNTDQMCATKVEAIVANKDTSHSKDGSFKSMIELLRGKIKILEETVTKQAFRSRIRMGKL
mmetsp:Transcript_22973/g.53278  ORF Transcript_22973/g.53278 Transcript_22973/m.53278 type:complete len:92 (-) Transcript_22973:770-1045(-)